MNLQHFCLIKQDVEIAALLEEIDRNANFWEYDTSRQTKVKVQRETQTIYLRSGKKPYPPGVSGNDVHESRPTKISKEFPTVLRWCEDFARDIGAELARVTLVKLPGGCRVYPHVDVGTYYWIRDRYHLVLRSPGGSVLISGGEAVVMREGELWVFDNKVTHEAMNPAGADRIHLIFDVLPNSSRAYFARSLLSYRLD